MVDFSMHKWIYYSACMHIFLQLLVQVLIELKPYIDFGLLFLTEVIRVLTNWSLHLKRICFFLVLDCPHLLITCYCSKLCKSCTCFHLIIIKVQRFCFI